jgi:hypothetical protein
MTFVIEWRRKSTGDDTLLAIEKETDAVIKSWPASTELLMDFLNDMKNLDDRPDERKSGNGVDHIHRRPAEWGDLVMSRGDDGDVIWLDPELYWDGVAYWFRSKGLDPHTYHAPRPSE